MDLNEISVFVKVVQAGSFTKAAAQLGIPNSTASARVSALERRLGVTLLQRTTRRLRPTEVGEAYFRRAAQGIAQIVEAETEASGSQRTPQGLLRVTAPVDLGAACLVGLVAAFRKQYPAVSLELVFTDRFVDLVAEGVDLAIRAGRLRDSALIARRIGVAHWILLAAPSYLAATGTPSHPRELIDHACLQFTPLGIDHWQLTDGAREINVPVPRQLLANEINFAKALAVAGKGIALLPSYICHAESRAGKLVRVLPAWHARTDPVHLVYPGQKFVAPKVRAFADMAYDALKVVFQESA